MSTTRVHARDVIITSLVVSRRDDHVSTVVDTSRIDHPVRINLFILPINTRHYPYIKKYVYILTLFM